MTRFDGGLGNQLFQYCAAKLYASRLGVESLFIPYKWYVDHYPNILDVVGKDLRATSTRQRLMVGNVPNEWPSWKRAIARCMLLLTTRLWPVVKITESVDLMQITPDEVPPATRRLLVDGTFQNPLIYDPHLEEVCQEILTTAPTVSDDFGVNRVAVSFRRGDYTPRGWTLDWAYYDAALESLAISKQQTSIWVISDDLDFSDLAAFRLRTEGYTVEQLPVITPSTALNDFWLLAYAENVVLSNSTFAWWAAAAGDAMRGADRHRVVVPSPWLWFYDRSLLRRSHWTAVDVSWTRASALAQRS